MMNKLYTWQIMSSYQINTLTIKLKKYIFETIFTNVHVQTIIYTIFSYLFLKNKSYFLLWNYSISQNYV